MWTAWLPRPPNTCGPGRFPREPLPESFVQTLSVGHGRIEQRYLTVSSQLNDYLDWPHLGQVFRLQRVVQRQKTGKITYQVVFGVTSLSAAECSPPPERRIRLTTSFTGSIPIGRTTMRSGVT